MLGARFDNDGGCFGLVSDNRIFAATFGGSFGSLSFDSVAQTGLSKEFVANDLTVSGTLAGGGDLGEVDLIFIPEPSTLILAAMAIIVVLSGRRMSWGQGAYS